MLRDNQCDVCGVVKLLRSTTLEPEYWRKRVCNRYRIDLREQRSNRRCQVRILAQRDRELHIARTHRLSVVPARSGVEMKRDRQRIRCPGPAVGEGRCKSCLPEYVERIANIGERLEYLLSNLSALGRDDQGWEQIICVRRCRYHKRSASGGPLLWLTIAGENSSQEDQRQGRTEAWQPCRREASSAATGTRTLGAGGDGSSRHRDCGWLQVILDEYRQRYIIAPHRPPHELRLEIGSARRD